MSDKSPANNTQRFPQWMDLFLKSDLDANQFAAALTQSANQTDKSEMESKVRVPSSCPLACQLPADVIDMTKKPDGIVATVVISRAK